MPGAALAADFHGGGHGQYTHGRSKKDREAQKGHGTGALGPSDTSDSGSDILGGPGLIEGDVIGLDHGNYEDIEGKPTADAGADIGDADLDSDSDSVGTGEHMTAGREPIRRENVDIRPDRIERLPAGIEGLGESDGE